VGFCLVGASIGVIGCQNTAEGAKEDTAKNGAAITNAADRAAEATKDTADRAAIATKDSLDKAAIATKVGLDKAAIATKGAAGDAGDRLTMTPKVKDAIIANKTLNNAKNHVNVDTAEGVVYLKGHVLSSDQKKLAGEIAEKTIKEAGSQDKMVNQLTIENH
jgi:osmotically-inducible protein OsmY